MNLSAMLEREDFFPLFFESVKEYFRLVYGKEVDIGFADKKTANLVIKPKLGAAMPPRLSGRARGFFYSEWNVRNSFVKYCIAKVGVFALTHSGKSFSQFYLRMLPSEMATKDLVIVPNNRSIRFFDYQTDTVGCIIKKGFTDKYFSNQIRFRTQYSYPFMVPLLRHGDTWFEEPILKGHPLARVTDQKAYQKGIADAKQGIFCLMSDTKREVDTNTYISNLLEKITDLTEQAKIRKQIKKGEKTLEIAKNAATIATKLDKITLCQSHGDFQSGNIWVDTDGKTWIYDWETAGERSVWYDISVLSYSLRRAYGWGDFWKNELPSQMLFEQQNSTPEQYRAMKCVVLLEDIVFYLEDMLELPENWGVEIYDAFVERIELLEF